MDFFGIGPLELLLILVIALIVFGPQRLPEIGRDLGKALREFRRATDDIRDSVVKEMEYEEIKKAAQKVRDTAQDVRASVSLNPQVNLSNKGGAVPHEPDPAPKEAPSTRETERGKP